MPTPEGLLLLLRQQSVQPTQWEASVRHQENSGIHSFFGDRVMIENAPASLLPPLFLALQTPWTPALEEATQTAVSAGCLLIAGWELGATPTAKLYLNASERSESVRKQLWKRTPWPDTSTFAFAPQLLAINANAEKTVWKAYLQHEDPTLLQAGPKALAFVERVKEKNLYAGAVASWELHPEHSAQKRAFFVGISSGSPANVAQLFTTLEGWDANAVARALPFAAGQCRSIGFETRNDRENPTHWTVYFKPKGTGTELHKLDPLARFRSPNAVVAIYRTPHGRGRAFASTAQHALEYRVHEGTPDRATLHTLLRWVHTEILQAERALHPLLPQLQHPPSPWTFEP